MKSVYVLLTETRVRAYTTHDRAMKVYQRAQRMGVKVEIASCYPRSGDPYKRVKVVNTWAPTPCPRCEPGQCVGDGGGMGGCLETCVKCGAAL